MRVVGLAMCLASPNMCAHFRTDLSMGHGVHPLSPILAVFSLSVLQFYIVCNYAY